MDKIQFPAAESKAGSYFTGFRRKRNEFFLSLIKSIKRREVAILDVGGTVIFWKEIGAGLGSGIKVKILNTIDQESDNANLTTVVGDARDMSCFGDKSFDAVFSNSVIEHVGAFDCQMKMANEVRRVGRNYFVQTPNLYFPVEAHFLFPYFQFLPMVWKTYLLTHFDLGYYKKMDSKEDAVKAINEIRLLRLDEVRMLFPDGKIIKEKLFGFTKSFIVHNF